MSLRSSRVYSAAMILSHYSTDPVGPLEPKEQPGLCTFKPGGLWVSVDGEDDWPHWCKENDYDGCGPYHYRVHVEHTDRVLVLDSVVQIKAFHGRRRLDRGDPWIDSIDWEAVARDHAGIIIAPYQWDCRLDLMWYYGWDCASGCIWDPSIIDRMELLSGPV